MPLHIINFAVVLFLLVSTTRGQLVSLTSPLGPNEHFYCDHEKISCVGSTTIILWTAPPSIPDNAPEGFASTDTQQKRLLFGDVNITLTNVVVGSPPMLTSELTLSNIPEVNVTCQTDLPGSLQQLALIRSTIPSMVEDHKLIHMGDSSFRSNWTTPSGTFDITNYVVTVLVRANNNDSALLLHRTTTDTFLDVKLLLGGGEVIRVFVQAMSRCSEVGMKSESSIVYIREINTVPEAVIAVAVISALMLLVFAVAVISTLLCLRAFYCQKYGRKCLCQKNTVSSQLDRGLQC